MHTEILRKFECFAPDYNFTNWLAISCPTGKLTGVEHDTRDLTLLVGPEKRPIYVHYALLVSQSPMIDTWMGPRWNNTTGQQPSSPPPHRHTLHLPHDCPDAWRTIVHFFYTGKIQWQHVLGALQVADFYSMEHVVVACEMVIIQANYGIYYNPANLRKLATLYTHQSPTLQTYIGSRLNAGYDNGGIKKERYYRKDGWPKGWYDHIRIVFQKLRRSADRTGDTRITIAADDHPADRGGGQQQVINAHSFVLKLQAPRVDLQLAEHILNASEVEMLLRHVYHGDTLVSAWKDRLDRRMRCNLWQLAEDKGLPKLAGDFEKLVSGRKNEAK